MTITLAEIELLSDDDLYQKLREFNKDVGPVVDSTRRLHQLTLLNNMNEMADAFNTETNIQFSQDEKVVEPDPIDAKHVEPRRSVSRAPEDEELPVPPKASPHTFKRWNEVDDPFANQLFDDAVSFRSRPSLSARPPISMYDARLPQPVKKGGSAIKTILLLGFVFVLATFIIFVVTQARDPYNNIESEANEVTGDEAGL